MSDDIQQGLSRYLLSRTDRHFDLSRHSHARVGLGHTGGHLKMQDWLAFQSGFAQAKDAVFSQFSSDEIASYCHLLGLTSLRINSQANDATQFLLRPDLGRLLAPESEILLEDFESERGKDLLLVISGGLSPLAIQQQVPAFLSIFVKLAREQEWSFAPVIINSKGRVALGDQINRYFKSKIVVMLIGERPGLTTPDSLGIYFTYNAKPGCTDEQRNCISNIHKQGLTHESAAIKLINLLRKAFVMKNTGISLKDDDALTETSLLTSR